MGRFADWLFGTVAAPPAVTAAGRVALATRATPTVPGWGFGPPLAPFTWDGEVPPWWDRDTAMTLPTISRSVQLIVSAVSALPFTFWQLDWNRVPAVERRVPGPTWQFRPDPDRTRQWLLGWTTDDLLFYGVAHWEITGRYATTFPSAFRRIAPGNLSPTATPDRVRVTDDDGTQREIPAVNVVEFLSPLQGLLSNGWRAISIALQLDAAADRFAATEVPAGVLEEQPGGEDLSPDELRELSEQFTLARQANTIAATNKYVRYRETPVDASQMQLVEARTYQALELARLGNIPPYLVGAPAGTGMTYLNGQQARQDLVDFGAAPIIGCIEQTLSGPNVTPAGTGCRLDLNAWLRNPFTTSPDAEPSPNDIQIADPTTPPTEVPA